MQFVHLADHERSAALDRSINGLRELHPEMTAGSVLSKGQRIALGCVAGALVVGLAVDWLATSIALIVAVTVVYVAMTFNRVLLFLRSRREGTQYVISDEAARAVPDGDLPVYTLLVPAYKEPEVVARLVDQLEQLEYPRHKLDVKLLLEADDDETIAVVRHLEVGSHVTVVLVPPAEPRTKPKALNYALTLARGEIVCIYDAEDAPDTLQLRRAVVALSQAGPDVACLQAKLSFGNSGQNLITKWFTAEYLMWFSYFLPGLVASRAALPLGGTSNHFRRTVLDELGGWDAFNVTEDADLGIRMSRLGYRCGVLDSTTLEEANSDFINWVKQRSRWYKGYLQTFLIHLRHPRQLRRELGWAGLGQFLLFVGGTPILAVLNPVFWVSTALWFLGHPHILRELYPAPVFYVATACWIFGNFVVCYLTVLTCRVTRRTDLIVGALLVPLYWVMMAIAAIKALYQLVANPSYWEKTTHGLDIPVEERIVLPASPPPAPARVPATTHALTAPVGGGVRPERRDERIAGRHFRP